MTRIHRCGTSTQSYIEYVLLFGLHSSTSSIYINWWFHIPNFGSSLATSEGRTKNFEKKKNHLCWETKPGKAATVGKYPTFFNNL